MVSEENKKLAFSKIQIWGQNTSRLLSFIIQGVWLFWFGSLIHKTKVFTFFEMKNFTP